MIRQIIGEFTPIINERKYLKKLKSLLDTFFRFITCSTLNNYFRIHHKYQLYKLTNLLITAYKKGNYLVSLVKKRSLDAITSFLCAKIL